MSDKLKDIVVVIVFMGLIIAGFAFNVIKKDSEISYEERRKLATMPKPSLKNVFNGTFFNKFESYTMDQFICRAELRKLKSTVELNVFNKSDMNDLYVYNGKIVKQEYPLNEASVNNVCDKMNCINNEYLEEANVYYTIVPDKNYYVDDSALKMDYDKLKNMMQEKLPDIDYIDIFDCLCFEDYYNKDTHWKQECLEKTANKIAESMKFSNRIEHDFETREVCGFQGVYAGQLPVSVEDDKICILTNAIIESSKVRNFDSNIECTVYNFEKIESPDRYDIYLSGATPIIEIENPNAKTEEELIVFRDSFGSSLVPLFTEAYKKITVIDTRYISSKYLGKYIDCKGKDVLFMYSALVINNSSGMK